MKKLLLIPLLMLLSCSSFHTLKKEVQNVDDAVVEHVMEKIEDILREKAREAETNVIAEVKDQKDLVSKVDNKYIKKSYDRLEPIFDTALKQIEPIVKAAAKEIQAQVREEIMEELTGEEINEACPDCKKEEVPEEPVPDKTVPDDTAKAEVKPAPADTTKVPEKASAPKTEAPAKTEAEPKPAKTEAPAPVKTEAKTVKETKTE